MSTSLKLFILFIETLLFVAGFLASVVFRLGWLAITDHEYVVLNAVSTAVIIQAGLFYNSMYDFRSVVATRVLVVRVIAAFVLANLVLALLFYIVPSVVVGRGVFLFAMLIDIAAFILWRVMLMRFLRQRPLRRILIVGDGELANIVSSLVRERGSVGYRLVGRLVPQDQVDAARAQREAMAAGEDTHVDPYLDEILGPYEQLKETQRKTQADTAVVAMSDRRGTMPVNDLLDLKFGGVEIVEGVDLYEQLTERIYVRELKPSWMIFGDGFRQSDARKVSKRALDIVVAFIGIILAAIPMFITALLVRLTSPGPAIYAQERVGEFGRVFTLYKFRSMSTDSEKAGPQFASERDPRVTPVGRFIRLTRLDELPQLFNVLKGDMSMVGPRPERPFFVIKLQREIPFFRQRLFVKPGVTGLAQVKFRYATDTDSSIEKLQYDLAYIKNMSILYDVQIVLETIKVILLRQGAH